jgi:hypothetical protein
VLWDNGGITNLTNFATADSAARAPADCEARYGALDFAPGTTSRTVTVNVKGDRTRESEEVFLRESLSATGAVTQSGQGTGVVRYATVSRAGQRFAEPRLSYRTPQGRADSPTGAVLPQRRLDLRISLGHGDERQGFAVPGRADVRSSGNEPIDDCGVVATARPAMDRSKRRPTERRAEVNGIATVDRDTSALEERLYQLGIADPACGVKRRAPIDTTGGFVETEAKHEVRGLPTAIEDGVRQT